MQRVLRRFGVLAVAALFAAAIPASGSSLAGSVLEGTFRSIALGGVVPFEIYLPPGYLTTTTRYPVIYFLHGLPSDSIAYRAANVWGAALEQLDRQALIVFPQGARPGDDDPEYLDWGPGRNWESALAVELPRFVDGHFRTVANRKGRALVGLSAGGYGATLLGMHHLAQFSVIESWSGYFHPTDPDGVAQLDLGSPQANARADAGSLAVSLRSMFARRPTFLAFYVGSGDPSFFVDNVLFDRQLALRGVPHLFEIYRGGHDSTLWQAHAPLWLRLALDHLTPPA